MEILAKGYEDADKAQGIRWPHKRELRVGSPPAVRVAMRARSGALVVDAVLDAERAPDVVVGDVITAVGKVAPTRANAHELLAQLEAASTPS